MRIAARRWYFSLLALVSLTALLIVIFSASWEATQVNLPSSRHCQVLPCSPIVIQVTRDGVATFRGKPFSGLRWPFDNLASWNWLVRTRYWKELFEPNGAFRYREGHYGWDIPILLNLDRDLVFMVPKSFNLQTNFWIATERQKDSLPRGLSLCIVVGEIGPAGDSRIILGVYWRGYYYTVPFPTNCIPVSIMPGHKYEILKNIVSIWLPKKYASSGLADLTATVSGFPTTPIPADEFRNILQSIGQRALLCVEVEKNVTVQEVVDFMDLCEDLNQIWTFYFTE